MLQPPCAAANPARACACRERFAVATSGAATVSLGGYDGDPPTTIVRLRGMAYDQQLQQRRPAVRRRCPRARRPPHHVTNSMLGRRHAGTTKAPWSNHSHVELGPARGGAASPGGTTATLCNDGWHGMLESSWPRATIGYTWSCIRRGVVLERR